MSKENLTGVALLKYVNEHPVVRAAKSNSMGTMDKFSIHHKTDVIKKDNRTSNYV